MAEADKPQDDDETKQIDRMIKKAIARRGEDPRSNEKLAEADDALYAALF